MLTVTDLHYRYPKSVAAALCGVSLQVKRGQILGLLGQNGAGKSTLVAHLAGLLAIQQGSIQIGDLTLQAQRLRDPSRIAIAPQEFAFYPMLSVRENLDCFAAVSRLNSSAASDAIARALSDVQLVEYAHVRSERLSGGLKRRLNLAIALLARPELIVLDEPTVGVDSQSRAFLLATVRRLAEEGAAVIYTTHYLEEVEAIADRVAILHRGLLLRNGPLTDLLSEGSAHLSVRFAQAPPSALLDQLALLGTIQLDGLHLHINMHMQQFAGNSVMAVLKVIEQSGTPLLQIHAGSTTLEQLFTRLIRDVDADVHADVDAEVDATGKTGLLS